MDQAKRARRQAQMMNAIDLRNQQEMTGVDGLRNLLSAIRRMFDRVLKSLRIVARVLYRSGGSGTAEDSNSTTKDAVTNSGQGIDVGALDSAGSELSASDEDAAGWGMSDKDTDALVDDIVKRPGGSLDMELEGLDDDLIAIIPVLQRHVARILETHLAIDADTAKVQGHLIALSETSECSRYAHRIVSRQIELVEKALADDPEYFGLSTGTIAVLVAEKSVGADSGQLSGIEAQLLALRSVQASIESGFRAQMDKMAAALATVAPDGGEQLSGPAQTVLVLALDAAKATAEKYRAHESEHAASALFETLPAVQEGLKTALDNRKAKLTAPAGEVEPDSTAVAPEAVAPPVASEAAVDDAHVAMPQAEAQRAASLAKVVRTGGGMFGNVAVRSEEERTAVEMDFDDADAMVEG